MKKKLLTVIITSIFFGGSALGAKNKVLNIGTRPESVTKGFDGKYYITVMNSPDTEGDGVIKVLNGDKSSVFAMGMDEPKGIAFTGKYLVTADQTK
ncbi:uncharacterized protein METZ01_LOCUS191769, partial [marine metagenome]